MTPRPYQSAAHAGVLDAYRRGKRAPVIICPTGGGKSCMGAMVVSGHVRKGGTVAWYAPRRELLVQAAETIRRFGLEVGIFGEGASHPVQILSTQTALARREVRQSTLAVVDECHHSSADEWLTVPQAHKDSGAYLLGLTATPERGDGRGLGPLFDHVVVAAQPQELVEAWRADNRTGLVPCEVVRPVRKVPKGKISTTPAKAYERHAKGRRAVVFAPNVAAAEAFQAEFAASGVRAVVVHGKQAQHVRASAFEAFASGHARVLLNVMIATEGWDCPAADVAILARDCGSTGLYLQMVGRVMRPFPGKTSCVLIDLRGTSYAHGHPQDDREYRLDGLGISAGTGAGIGPGERRCRVCGKPLDDQLVCTECGRDHSPGAPDSAEIEMARWESKRREGDGDRVAQLARWFRKFPGRKPGFFMHRYKAVYGHVPPVELWQRAQRGKGAA